MMDKKGHDLQFPGRIKLGHHHSERRQQTMSVKIVQLTEEVIKGQIKDLVHRSVKAL